VQDLAGRFDPEKLRVRDEIGLSAPVFSTNGWKGA
jgi:hypothetical protein